MVQPTKNLYIWAENDVILPTANRPNKKKPQDSLILTGFDQSQKPAADEWNDLLNRITLWLKYIADEKLGTYLEKSENLNDLANKATARINLDVYEKSETFTQTEVNNKQINTSNGLIGGGDLSSNRTISLSSISSCISVLTGTVVDEGTIPLPSGYSEDQCMWMVSMNNDNNGDRPWDIYEQDARLHYKFICQCTGRVVSARSYAFPAGWTAGTANYIIIGVK